MTSGTGSRRRSRVAGDKRPTGSCRTSESQLPRKPVTEVGPFYRSTMSAGKTLVVVVIALLLGGLLNVTSLTEAAERQPGGLGRDVSLVLVWPFRQISSIFGLDQPRAILTERLGRPGAAGDDDGTQTASTTSGGGDVAVDTQGQAVESLEADALAAAAAIAGREAIDPEAVAIPLDYDPNAPALQSAGELPERLQQEFNAENRLEIAVIGDSLTEQLGPAIIDLTNGPDIAAHTTHDFTYSSGLTRPDFYDWPARAAEIAEQSDPDLWVVMLGANDAQDVRDDEGRFLHIGSDEWEAIYESRIGALMDQLTEAGRAVIWVGQPVMRAATFDESMDYISGLYARQAQARSLVSFVDSRRVFDDASGSYADYLTDQEGQLVQMRLGDGVHLTRRGAERLADQIVPLLPLVEVDPAETQAASEGTSEPAP